MTWSVYDKDHMRELRIKNRSERHIRSCEITFKAVTNKGQTKIMWLQWDLNPFHFYIKECQKSWDKLNFNQNVPHCVVHYTAFYIVIMVQIQKTVVLIVISLLISVICMTDTQFSEGQILKPCHLLLPDWWAYNWGCVGWVGGGVGGL